MAPTTTVSMTSNERFLRMISMWIAVPAIPLIITTGVVANKIPAFGTIPHVGSALLAVFLLGYAKDPLNVSLRVCYFADAALLFTYFGLCMPIWIDATYSLKYSPELLMLDTYASCFLIINMLIHLYFVLVNGNKLYHEMRKCPCCHDREQQAEEGRALIEPSSEESAAPPKYVLLEQDAETTPRTSEERC